MSFTLAKRGAGSQGRCRAWLPAVVSLLPVYAGPAAGQVTGVEYINRASGKPAIHIVTIDRSLADYELRVLTDPVPTRLGYAYLRTVPDLASAAGAVVAINGYLWHGGDKPGAEGKYQSTTIVDGVTLVELPTPHMETMLGIAEQDSSGLRLQKFSQDEFLAGNFPDYRHHLLGSNTSLMIAGACLGDDHKSQWSAIGYGPDKVVMISSDWGSRNGVFRDSDLCAVFEEFGVTDAIRLDGGGSPSLVVDGVHVNPRGWPRDPARAVATAIGLVPSSCGTALQNPGFEDPVISPPWQRFNSIPGWTGPIDVHREPDLPASEGAQVVDLNQNSFGYVSQTINTVAGREYTVRWAQGVNYHCIAAASLSLDIDNASVGTFASTATPVYKEATFAAAASTTTLRFRSLTAGCGAATVDDVSISCQ